MTRPQLADFYSAPVAGFYSAVDIRGAYLGNRPGADCWTRKTKKPFRFTEGTNGLGLPPLLFDELVGYDIEGVSFGVGLCNFGQPFLLAWI